MRDETGFREFVEANGARLLHAARLLTGDHQRGEDLVQAALAKLYLRWGRAREPLAYTRRVLVSTHIDGTRRRWRGERPTEILPEQPTDGGLSASDERDELRRMLRELTPLERSIVVLRYYCDLTEKDTAASLRIPVGTVKSGGARALARMRVVATSEVT